MSNQRDIDALHRNWVWVTDWQDSSTENTAGRLVTFTRKVQLDSVPSQAIIQCTADTRYKLLVNGFQICAGPSRSAPERWLYDTVDLAAHLVQGENTLVFVVMRWFYANRAAMPFVRTGHPGLTVTGTVGATDISTGAAGWTATVDFGTLFPTGLIDDVFLHINERGTPKQTPASIKAYNLRLVNGELPPWRLHPRLIPLQEQSPVKLNTIRALTSPGPQAAWEQLLRGEQGLSLSVGSEHKLDIQAGEHSTAFIKWQFRAPRPTKVRLRVVYSEAYEREPRRYPFLRVKDDRLDSTGLIIGPHDEVTLEVDGDLTYEPFWFRTFRLLRVEISCTDDVEIVSVSATQTNYPLEPKATWENPGDAYARDIFDISIRTMRNCMFDAYSDCPFYEQLSYSGDSRSVGLFHYLLSGDDRLARQTIISFAGSITPEGLTQSRYPSQVPQIIAGFPLYWTLSICDHMLYFGDAKFVRPLLPLIDGVLDFFDRHIDELGLVSGLPMDVWQYVDWVTGWHETEEHPDKGVPTAGRASNRHTYFSMLYAWTLQHAAKLVEQLGRPHLGVEYIQRSDAVVRAIKKHCYDETLSLFTDSTSDVPPDTLAPRSQHVQVFAVLCGAADVIDAPRLLRTSFAPDTTLGKCSYVMMFYASRAFTKAGIYNEMFEPSFEPWRRMVRQNMSTWEEDDVRQRSDCHAWGSVPIYEYLYEVAGVQPSSPGCAKIVFAPRVGLSKELKATVALGSDNTARVKWETDESGECHVGLELDKAADVVSRSPNGEETEHGFVRSLELRFKDVL